MKIRLTPAAEADVRDAFNWYRGRGEGFASAFRQGLDMCLIQIGRNPLEHPAVYGELRRALLRRFPYGVFYVVGEAEIGVFHGRRDPKVWQARHDT